MKVNLLIVLKHIVGSFKQFLLTKEFSTAQQVIAHEIASTEELSHETVSNILKQQTAATSNSKKTQENERKKKH